MVSTELRARHTLSLRRLACPGDVPRDLCGTLCLVWLRELKGGMAGHASSVGSCQAPTWLSHTTVGTLLPCSQSHPLRPQQGEASTSFLLWEFERGPGKLPC